MEIHLLTMVQCRYATANALYHLTTNLSVGASFMVGPFVSSLSEDYADFASKF